MSFLNLVSVVGLLVMLILAWLMSSHKTKVNWRLVVMGLGLQLLLAAIFFNSQSWTFPVRFDGIDSVKQSLNAGEISVDQVNAIRLPSGEVTVGDQSYTKFSDLLSAHDAGEISQQQVNTLFEDQIHVPRFVGGVVFHYINQFFVLIDESVKVGSGFVFNVNGGSDPPTNVATLLYTFAFGVLPTVIFFAALMSVLYHIGLMQKLVTLMAWGMQKTLGTSGAESLAAAANVFVGHTEAPLVVRPYIGAMTRSELNALMVGGFATITGGLMAVFVAQGVSAGHLVVASLVSAPAALVIAKILQPETEQPETSGETQVKFERTASNVIEAAANGASDGMKLALNITAMLIAFLALIAMVDLLLGGAGELLESFINRFREVPLDLNWSLAGVFGILFWPFALVMGIEPDDCAIAGELLGTKMVVNEFVAYLDMGSVLRGEKVRELADGTQQTVAMSERTEIIMTYALCGFSNFGAIAIQLGGIGPLAPERRKDLAALGFRAMLGGTLACCMTACVAGAFYGLLS